MVNSKTYFGFPDAGDEQKENVLADHVSFKVEEGLKWQDKKIGVQVIIGPKGSGKTAIRRFVEEKEGSRCLIWNIDVNNTYLDIDAKDFPGKSGKIKNYISVLLLANFLRVIQAEAAKRGLDKKAITHISAALKRGGEILGNFKEGVTEVDLGLLKLDPKALLKEKTTSVVNNAFTEIVKEIKEALASKRGYILIDDADDVIENLEKNPRFIEGLVRAVKDINENLGERLHVLLFLKSGVYQVWHDSQHELNKVRHVIEELTSDEITLQKLIAKRIARIHKEKYQDGKIEDLWAREFAWKPDRQTFKAFSRKITGLCVSGPRDILVIANSAKTKSADKKIRAAQVNQIINSYSRDKLNEIGADFGDVYPQIHNLIQLVFGGYIPEAKGIDVAKHIDKTAFQAGKIYDQFHNLAWFRLASKEKLLLLMFQIGLFGIKKGKDPVFFNQDETIAIGDLLENTLLLHPAFISVLGISAKRKK